MELLRSVLDHYGIVSGPVKSEVIGSGLIHNSWKISTGDKQYVLQQINENVFRCPPDIMHNINLIEDYLKEYFPSYFFVEPVRAIHAMNYVHLNERGYYRLFPFVRNSHSKVVVNNSQEAFEAANQFGKFSNLLSGFDSSRLRITIPYFHDLEFRYQQFLLAIEQADPTRLKRAQSLIRKLVSHSDIVSQYKRIINDSEFRIRVTHHDTKISNVLFDKNDKGLCVIDLDTVMPGLFISDVGDMMRSYLSINGEDQQQTQLLDIREEIYRAIVQGYGEAMKDQLTESEKTGFFYAGKYMIYMQAIRFLTDYLQKDKYYGETYPEQNYFRAENQSILLERFIEKQSVLEQYHP